MRFLQNRFAVAFAAIPFIALGAAPEASAQWTVHLRAMQNPLPLGQCTAIEVVVKGANGVTPLRPNGSQIDWQDFELNFVSSAPDAFAWSDEGHRFLCARAPTAPTAHVVAYYPGRHLREGEFVPGVSVQQVIDVAMEGVPQPQSAAAPPSSAAAAPGQPYVPAGAVGGAAGAGQPQQAGGYPTAGAPAGAPAGGGAVAGAAGAGQPPQAGYPAAGAPAGVAAGAGAVAGAASAGQPPQAGYPTAGAPAGAPAGAAAGAAGAAVPAGAGAGAAGAGQPQPGAYPSAPAGAAAGAAGAAVPAGAGAGAAGAGQPQPGAYPSASAGQPQQAVYTTTPPSPVAAPAVAGVPAQPEAKKKKGGFFKTLGTHLKEKANEVTNQTAANLTSSATQVVDATAQTGSNLVAGATAEVTSTAQSKVGGIGTSLVPSSLRSGANADNLDLAVKSGQAVLRMVRFVGSTDVLDASGRDVVRRLADVLKTNPGNYLIQAHVDPVPSPLDPQRLSEQRAAAVKSALIRSGVEEPRLKALGYGVSSPRPEVPPEGGPPTSARIEIWKMQ